VKKYWQLAALIVGTIVGFFLLQRRENAFVEDFKKVQQTHAEELKKIQEARDEERAKLVENQKKLESALVEIQKKYDAAELQFDDKKKAEVEQIVKEHGNDPIVLAQKLSESTGFRVILPEE
jgi:Skp family chaperone for outer membrane proteins